MKLILYNDDFGLSYGFTEAIADAHLKGLTTSTCIRPNGIAYKYAVSLLKIKLKTLDVGLHVNLTEGPTHLPLLADQTGQYKYNFFSYLNKLMTDSSNLKSKIEKELEFQFQMVLKDKINITHVNGQDHIHMIPQIFEIVAKLCFKYGIKYIRISHEPFYLTNNLSKDLQPVLNTNLAKHFILNYFAKYDFKTAKKYNLKSVDAFYGILHTNHMDFQAVSGAINNGLKNNLELIEIMGHPAYANTKEDKKYTSPFIKQYIASKERAIETKTFQSEELKDFLQTKKIELISYRDLLKHK